VKILTFIQEDKKRAYELYNCKPKITEYSTKARCVQLTTGGIETLAKTVLPTARVLPGVSKKIQYNRKKMIVIRLYNLHDLDKDIVLSWLTKSLWSLEHL